MYHFDGPDPGAIFKNLAEFPHAPNIVCSRNVPRYRHGGARTFSCGAMAGGCDRQSFHRRSRNLPVSQAGRE